MHQILLIIFKKFGLHVVNTLFRKPLLFSVLTFVFFAYGCTGKRPPAYDADKANVVDNIMNSWVGHYQTELVAAWGQPTEVVSGDRGGRILIYESLKGTWGEETDKHIVGGAQYKARPLQEGYTAIRKFYVNEEGIIYSWEWEGL